MLGSHLTETTLDPPWESYLRSLPMHGTNVTCGLTVGSHGNYHRSDTSYSPSHSFAVSPTGSAACWHVSNSNVSPDWWSVEIDSTTIEYNVTANELASPLLTSNEPLNIEESCKATCCCVKWPPGCHLWSTCVGSVSSTASLPAPSTSSPATLNKAVTSMMRTSLTTTTDVPSTAAEHTWDWHVW